MMTSKRSIQFIRAASAAAVLFVVGCSNSYLNSGTQVDETTLMGNLSTISSNVSGSLSSNVVSALDQNNTTEIFYVQNDNTRPPESVFSIGDMGFVNSNWSGEAVEDVGVQTVEVFFLDGYVNDGSQNDPRTFILELSILDDTGTTTYYAAQSGDGTYSFTNTDFSVTMTSSDGSGQITLYSTNLSSKYSEELNNTVTFSVYDSNNNYVGQITALHEYQ
jgi:hypothetical protein